jgi:hypothetical protein
MLIINIIQLTLELTIQISCFKILRNPSTIMNREIWREFVSIPGNHSLRNNEGYYRVSWILSFWFNHCRIFGRMPLTWTASNASGTFAAILSLNQINAQNSWNSSRWKVWSVDSYCWLEQNRIINNANILVPKILEILYSLTFSICFISSL